MKKHHKIMLCGGLAVAAIGVYYYYISTNPKPKAAFTGTGGNTNSFVKNRYANASGHGKTKRG